jgi:hypothetical protein
MSVVPVVFGSFGGTQHSDAFGAARSARVSFDLVWLPPFLQLPL